MEKSQKINNRRAKFIPDSRVAAAVKVIREKSHVGRFLWKYPR